MLYYNKRLMGLNGHLTTEIVAILDWHEKQESQKSESHNKYLYRPSSLNLAYGVRKKFCGRMSKSVGGMVQTKKLNKGP